MGEKVKLAFQGGGARLASIIAAAEAIQDLKRDGVLDIVATAGTSAGAFGAVLSAIPDADIPAVRDKLLKIDNKTILDALPSFADRGKFYRARALYNIARGHPIVSMNPLRKLVEDALKPLGITPSTTFEDLQIGNTRVVAANVRTKQRVVRWGSDKVIDSLVESAALPIIYRMPKSPGDCSVVDGSLFANLPIEEVAEISDGEGDETIPTVALSFDDKTYNEEAETVLAYITQILNAMIDHQVLAAKLKLKQHVCLIETNLRTFDSHLFKEALDDEPYKISKDSVIEFFKGPNGKGTEVSGWIDRQRQGRIERGSTTLDERNDSVRLKDLVSELTQFSDRQIESLMDVDVDQFRFVVIAYSLLSKEGEARRVTYDDRVDMVFKIPECEKPISCLRTELMKSSKGTISGVEWVVKNANEIQLKYFCFPLYGDGGVQSHLVVFDPPLGTPETGPGPYQVHYTQHLQGGMDDLRTKISDVLAQSCATFRSFKQADIVLYVPEDLKLTLVSVPDARALEKELNLPSNSVDLELVEGRWLTDAAERVESGFTSYTWRTEGLKRGQAVAVKYIKA